MEDALQFYPQVPRQSREVWCGETPGVLTHSADGKVLTGTVIECHGDCNLGRADLLSMMDMDGSVDRALSGSDLPKRGSLQGFPRLHPVGTVRETELLNNR